ncbi:MAG TPA: hypothetical protein VHL80_21180 [Polyangia bacterium]|nr:hypothetical protein [Polyangia bacterium]
MSGNIRNFVIAAVVVLGSVTAVRSLSASPEAVLDDPPISMTATRRVELEDVSLAEAIRHFAALARLPKHAVAP